MRTEPRGSRQLDGIRPHYMGLLDGFPNFTVLPEIAVAKVRREDAPFDKDCYIGLRRDQRAWVR